MPVCASLTPSPALISGSTAVGTISAVTMTNVAAPSTMSNGQGSLDVCSGRGVDDGIRGGGVVHASTLNSNIDAECQGLMADAFDGEAGNAMKIGELATRAGVSPRLVRYYEQQQLLAPTRQANGYRAYDEEHVAR